MLRNVHALALLSALVCGSSASAQTFDRAAWQGDYATLKSALEAQYANLVWMASPESGVNLPAIDRRTRAALAAAESDEDARTAILQFVRSFHDGHFSQLASAEPKGSTSPALPEPTYSRSDSLTGCASLGYAPNGSLAFSLPFETLAGFRILTDGIHTPFRAGIISTDSGKHVVGIVRIPEFEERQNIEMCLDAWKRDEMWGPAGRLRRGVLNKFVEAQWYVRLADVLASLKSNGAEAVLVDIGNNSGGDDSGDIAARLFTRVPLHSSRLLLSQNQAASAGYIREEIDALTGALASDSSNAQVREQLALFRQREQAIASPACKVDWVWTEQRAWSSGTCRRLVDAGSAGGPLDYLAPAADSRTAAVQELHWPSRVSQLYGSWSGPLYVLTDARTYSAAEMFAAVLQNNGAAKTIGGRTGGDGCGFMGAAPVIVLPYSKLRFRAPNCVRLRADGTSEVAGVAPDISVMPRDGEPARIRAARLLDQLVADLLRVK